MKIAVALSVASLLLTSCRTNSVPPEKAASEFVKSMGMKVQGSPSCTGVDTDNDGYVSCTVMVSEKDKEPHTMQLQCAGITSFACSNQTSTYATGCKETVVKFPVVKQE